VINVGVDGESYGSWHCDEFRELLNKIACQQYTMRYNFTRTFGDSEKAKEYDAIAMRSPHPVVDVTNR
jgi:hypothetical protein